MENKNKEIENLLKEENLHQFKMENMHVEMLYSQNNKNFKECMLNILKQKVKKS